MDESTKTPKPVRTVRFAARKAAKMYVNGRSEKTVTLKQCIAASSRDCKVPYGEIESYLMGAGARAICNSIQPDSNEETVTGDCEFEVYKILYDGSCYVACSHPSVTRYFTIDASSSCFISLCDAWELDAQSIDQIDENPGGIRKLIREAAR